MKKVIFTPRFPEDANCKRCDHGHWKHHLIEGATYEVVHQKGNRYELMGWGSMKFAVDCFVDVEESDATSSGGL